MLGTLINIGITLMHPEFNSNESNINKRGSKQEGMLIDFNAATETSVNLLYALPFPSILLPHSSSVDFVSVSCVRVRLKA